MDDKFPLSLETVVLFLAILFLAFCCGTLRSCKRYFTRRPTHQPLSNAQRQILITHINLPRTRTTTATQVQNETDGVYPGEEQIMPPPYSAVSYVLPPSYDEAIKQEPEIVVTAPKNDNRF